MAINESATLKKDNPAGARNPVVWTVLGTVLGLILLYASTRKVNTETLVATIRSADPMWAIGVLAATLGFAAIKTWRWKLLLRFVPDLRFSRLHASIYVGMAVNFLIAHVGEFLRSTEVAKGGSASVSAVFGTIVIERVLDFIALLVLLVFVSIFAPALPGYIGMAVLGTSAVVIVALACLYMLLRTPDWLLRAVAFIGRPLPDSVKAWCLSQFEQLRTGMVALRDVRTMIVAVAASVLQWALVVLAIWCSAMAIGESVSVVPAAATFVLIIVGLTLPNSPMQIGTTQLAFTVGLGTGGVMATEAVAASLVYTLFLIVPIMAIGGVCLVQGRRTPSRVRLS